MNKLLFAGAAAAATLLAGAANATVITRTFDINASNFNLSFGAPTPLPYASAHLKFTLTLDPTVSTGATTSGLTVNSFNLPYAVQYAYSPSSVLTVATNAMIGGCGNPANSFCAFISNPFGASPNTFFFQQDTASSGYWVARNVSTALASVPEPATWGLMLMGFGAMGAALRSRRRAVTA